MERDFSEVVDDFVETTQLIIKELEKELQSSKEHSERCKIVKGASTVTSIIGGGIFIGGLFLAPFTGGTSVIAATGIGSAIGIGGAVGNIGTDIFDMCFTKYVSGQIEKLTNKRNAVSTEFTEHLKRIQDEALILKEEEGITEEEAFVFSIFRQSIKFRANFTTFAKMGRFKNFSTFFRSSGNEIWKGMRILSQNLIKGLSNLGINISKKTAMSIVRNGNIVFNSLFLVLDFKYLLKDIKELHPLEKAIRDLIKSLEKELENVKLIKEFLDESKKHFK